MDLPYLEYMRSERYTHFFGYGFYAHGDVKVPEDLLEGKMRLREMFGRASEMAAIEIDPDPILIDYALQKVSVPDPSLYIQVSAELPHTRALSRRLKSAEDILLWMRQNLSNGSIFPDCEDRVMISDEVIVFKTGNPIDKAILFCALTVNHGENADIETMTGRVIIRTDNSLIDMHELTVEQR